MSETTVSSSSTDDRPKKERKRFKDEIWFEFETSDVAAISDLMYGLRDLVKTVRLSVSEEGIEIGEYACQDQVFLYAFFRSVRFGYFNCKTGQDGKPITICLHPEKLHNVLKLHHQRDCITCEYSSRRPQNLTIIKSPQGRDDVQQEYELPLLIATPSQYSSLLQKVDYILAFNAGILSNIITCFNSVHRDFNEDWITISCNPNRVTFNIENGCIFQRCRFTLHTRINEQIAKPQARKALAGDCAGGEDGHQPSDLDDITYIGNEEEVVNQYKLQYLQQMLRCFSITKGGIFVYVSKRHPIVFEVKIGTLGDLKATLMFRVDGDSESCSESGDSYASSDSDE